MYYNSRHDITSSMRCTCVHLVYCRIQFNGYLPLHYIQNLSEGTWYDFLTKKDNYNSCVLLRKIKKKSLLGDEMDNSELVERLEYRNIHEQLFIQLFTFQSSYSWMNVVNTYIYERNTSLIERFKDKENKETVVQIRRSIIEVLIHALIPVSYTHLTLPTKA